MCTLYIHLGMPGRAQSPIRHEAVIHFRLFERIFIAFLANLIHMGLKL